MLVKYKGKCCELPVVVVEGRTRSLLGRNWLREMILECREIFSMIATTMTADEMEAKYPKVVQSGLGTLQGTEAKIHVDKDAQPIYCKATDLKNRTGLSIYFWETEANGGHIEGTT